MLEHGSASPQLFPVVWISWGPWVSFVATDEFSLRFTKITSRIGVSWTHSLPFNSNPMNFGHIIKRCKPGNSLKLSFTNIRGLRSNSVDCESFLESNPPDVLALWESLFGLFSFNLKGFYYSYAWSRSLCEGRTSFCTGLISRKLCRFLLMFSTGFTSLSVLLLFPLSITFFVFMHGLRIFVFCI